MPTAARSWTTPLPGAVLSAYAVVSFGTAAHALAGGATPGAVPTLLAGIVVALAFALVSRGTARPLAMAPVVNAAQVLLHVLPDLPEHGHHGGVIDAVGCLVREPRMGLAHVAAVGVTVGVLVLLEPLLEPERLAVPAGLASVPEHPGAPGTGSSEPVPQPVFAVHAPRRGPPGPGEPA